MRGWEVEKSLTVNNKLAALFQEWQAARNYSGFFHDGIIGEKDWSNKHPKILFLLKENYSADWGIDGPIDIWSGTNTQFFSNLARWKYLIENVCKNHEPVDYPDDETLVEYLGGLDLRDVAYVNVKKSIGGSQSDNKEIQNFAVQDKEFLTKEIDIINPDIVVCGGTFWSYHPIYDGNETIEKIADRVYKHNNRVIVDFHHPGWKQCPGGPMELYDRLNVMLGSGAVMELLGSSTKGRCIMSKGLSVAEWEELASKIGCGEWVRTGATIWNAGGQLVGVLKIPLNALEAVDNYIIKGNEKIESIKDGSRKLAGHITGAVNYVSNMAGSAKDSTNDKQSNSSAVASGMSTGIGNIPMDALSLITCGASVATLGVCVAGFYVINERIKQLDANLEKGLKALSQKIDKIQKTMDRLNKAEINRGLEILIDSGHTKNFEKRNRYLDEAEQILCKHRNYYYELINTDINCFLEEDLNLAQIRELYARYFQLALGEMYALFYQDDYELCKKRGLAIDSQISEIIPNDFAKVFNERVEKFSINTHENLIKERDCILELSDFLIETKQRISSISDEAILVQSLGLSVRDYIQQIEMIGSEGPLFMIKAT